MTTPYADPNQPHPDPIVEAIRHDIAVAKARWTAGDHADDDLIEQHYRSVVVIYLAEALAKRFAPSQAKETP